jgi:CIC family chloride channel protein
LYALLGAVAGVVGVGFIRVLYGAEDLADRLWRGPEWLRPAVGGVLLGLLLLALPQLYGVGYPVLESAVRGNVIVGLLPALLVGKMVATSLTIAIGGSGGVFAPSLFMGAMLGVAHRCRRARSLRCGGSTCRRIRVGGHGGGVRRGSARPITAVIIIFELTGDYTIILPLMTAVVIAAAVSALLTRDTIYTLKPLRRGIDVTRGRGANLMRLITVAEAMQPLSAPITAACSRASAARSSNARQRAPLSRGRRRASVTSASSR